MVFIDNIARRIDIVPVDISHVITQGVVLHS
jgi:hypothetical protein